MSLKMPIPSETESESDFTESIMVPIRAQSYHKILSPQIQLNTNYKDYNLRINKEIQKAEK
jgi:hypothetical protein